MKEEVTKRCFVISPIGDENSDTRKRSDQIFSCVIEKAVAGFGYKPMRADKDPRPGIITFQIVQHLLEDELVIADLTGQNPNVFYELGIRHAVRKPIILIKDVSEIIPFDIVNMRTINVDYRYVKSMNECRDEVIKQIEDIENHPDQFLYTPISFTLNSMLLKNNTDPQSKVLMNLASQIQMLTSQIHMLSLQVGTLLKQNSSTSIMTNDLRISVDDLQRDEKIITDNLMRELCQRDKDARTNDHVCEFILDEIIKSCLGAYSKEYVYQFIFKFESELGYIQVLPNNRISLTDEGRKHCHYQ